MIIKSIYANRNISYKNKNTINSILQIQKYKKISMQYSFNFIFFFSSICKFPSSPFCVGFNVYLILNYIRQILLFSIIYHYSHEHIYSLANTISFISSIGAFLSHIGMVPVSKFFMSCITLKIPAEHAFDFSETAT